MARCCVWSRLRFGKDTARRIKWIGKGARNIAVYLWSREWVVNWPKTHVVNVLVYRWRLDGLLVVQLWTTVQCQILTALCSQPLGHTSTHRLTYTALTQYEQNSSSTITVAVEDEQWFSSTRNCRTIRQELNLLYTVFLIWGSNLEEIKNRGVVFRKTPVSRSLQQVYYPLLNKLLSISLRWLLMNYACATKRYIGNGIVIFSACHLFCVIWSNWILHLMPISRINGAWCISKIGECNEFDSTEKALRITDRSRQSEFLLNSPE